MQGTRLGNPYTLLLVHKAVPYVLFLKCEHGQKGIHGSAPRNHQLCDSGVPLETANSVTQVCA